MFPHPHTWQHPFPDILTSWVLPSMLSMASPSTCVRCPITKSRVLLQPVSLLPSAYLNGLSIRIIPISVETFCYVSHLKNKAKTKPKQNILLTVFSLIDTRPFPFAVKLLEKIVFTSWVWFLTSFSFLQPLPHLSILLMCSVLKLTQLLTKKKMHDLKVGTYVLFGEQNWGLKPRTQHLR